MREVLQTILATPVGGVYEPGNVGNCVQAAIASALDLGIDSVPHFVDYPATYEEWNRTVGDPLIDEHGALWYRACRRWTREQYGMDFGGFDADRLPWFVDMYAKHPDAWPRCMIGTVNSPRGGFQHAVVLNEHGDIAWDPHPAQNAYGLEVVGFEAFVPIYEPAPPTLDEERSIGALVAA